MRYNTLLAIACLAVLVLLASLSCTTKPQERLTYMEEIELLEKQARQARYDREQFERNLRWYCSGGITWECGANL